MSETGLRDLIPSIGSILNENGRLSCSWEDSHLLQNYDFSTVQHWIISSSKLPANEVQGYQVLKRWLLSAEFSIMTSSLVPELKNAINGKHHRFLENAGLVAAELISNALKADVKALEPDAPVELAHLATPEGVFLSVKDYQGELKPQSFFPALVKGMKNPQLEDSARGAGIGLYLILRYSSVVLIDSIQGESSRVSVFIPARSNGTKLFYFKQEG